MKYIMVHVNNLDPLMFVPLGKLIVPIWGKVSLIKTQKEMLACHFKQFFVAGLVSFYSGYSWAFCKWLDQTGYGYISENNALCIQVYGI